MVGQSHLPAKKTLAQLGIPKTTFYRWYERYQAFGEAGLEDPRPHPGRVWNRIPDDIRDQVVELALEEPELSPRELAVRFTDTKRHYISEASAYRILKERDLITSPAFIVIKAADEFRDKTTRPNELPLSSPQAATAGPRANGLHLSESNRVGLVLSQHDPG